MMRVTSISLSWPIRPKVWPILFLLDFVVATGCVDARRDSEVTPVLPSHISCETEARQLSEATDVYPAPQFNIAPVVNLAQGRFVYRCEQRDDWLGIMFPAFGEKVDCAERPPEQACSLGWIRRNTLMEILG